MTTTPEEILEKHYKNYKKRIAFDDQVIMAMEEYANLQKPEWIPIKSLSELPVGRIWVTFKSNIDDSVFVQADNGELLKKGFLHKSLTAIAYIPVIPPTPYQP